MATPHLVQYQGSKRKLAPDILRYFPKERISRLIEPFCGVCAVTIAAAERDLCDSYWINDVNAPLVAMMRATIETPDALADAYAEVWEAQFTCPGGHVEHFLEERDRFNSGDRSPELMLYLIARCVKGALRYAPDGRMNQSADKRRHGTKPETIRRNARRISTLLKGRCDYSSGDFIEVLERCTAKDLIYMDPPYQGTTYSRDSRYMRGVEFEALVGGLRILNERGSRFILSYDGYCGERSYGREIPSDLQCEHIMIDAGRSTQATFLGKNETTVESLYLSHGLVSSLMRKSA